MRNGFLSTGWAKKGPVRRLGFFFPFLFFIFHRLGCNEKIEKKKLFSKIMKKKFQLALFSTLGGGQETTFYIKVA